MHCRKVRYAVKLAEALKGSVTGETRLGERSFA
jgi:hypothetical protein